MTSTLQTSFVNFETKLTSLIYDKLPARNLYNLNFIEYDLFISNTL